MVTNGDFKQVSYSASVFHYHQKDISVVARGDDFTALGDNAALGLVQRGGIAEDGREVHREIGEKTSRRAVRIFNREFEADQRRRS